MADIRLSNSVITSSAIPLQGASLAVGWKNLVSVPVFPAVYTGSDAVTEVQFMGWENPIYSIRGYLREGTSGTITYSLLKQYAKATSSTYLYDDIIASSGVKVAVMTFDVQRRAVDKDDNIYDYSIKLVETK